jgi:hypothetical protein
MFNSPRLRRLSVIVAFCVFVGVLWVNTQHAVSQDAADDSQVTQATMRGIFTALTTAYGYSLDMEYFEDRHNREDITAALEALVFNTDALEDHGGGLDPSFDYLRRSLATDAEQALQRFQDRQFLGSQFMLSKLMENCATCHGRLPADQAFDTGARFLQEANVAAIPPVDRVNIEIATRQFDNALETYEEIFALPNMTDQGLSLIGAFEGYLKLCIGVVGDTDRAIATLQTFIKRSDMPDELRKQVGLWISALGSLDLAAAQGKELETARSLVGEADVMVRRAPNTYPDRLIEFIAASSLLHRYLQAASTYDDTIAEAYYLLAVAESQIAKSFWISETAFLLEKSIRQAPKTESAAKAYRALKEYVKAAQSTSAGDEMDIDLDELQKLIQG